MNEKDIPIGFGIDLANNELAYNAFHALAEAQQQAVLARAREAQTENEVQALISCLAQGKFF